MKEKLLKICKIVCFICCAVVILALAVECVLMLVFGEKHYFDSIWTDVGAAHFATFFWTEGVAIGLGLITWIGQLILQPMVDKEKRKMKRYKYASKVNVDKFSGVWSVK